MTRLNPLWLSVRKEAHALWPAWAAGAVTVAVVGLLADSRLSMPGRLAYFVASVTLAALAIGHEYTHRTLSLLLSCPVDRQRLLGAKLLALVPMLLTLGALAFTVIPPGLPFDHGASDAALSTLCAVLMAPWLTMLCRNPLAGVVFAIGATGMLHIAALAVVIARYELIGPTRLGLAAFGEATLVTVLAAACALSAVADWRLFMRLEAIDGRDADVSWPRWLRSAITRADMDPLAAARRGHPIWLLVKKEFRIQQMSLVVAGINVLIWPALAALDDFAESSRPVMEVVGVLYGGLLAILVGALASAEERQMGTLEWQTLLPVAAWRQFAVKVAVALSLSLVLALGLPVLLAGGELSVSIWHAGAVLLLTIGSLYVSSLCGSGLKAMAVSAPVMFVLAVLLGWSFSFASVGRDAGLAAIAGLAALALWFAFVNHHTARS